MAGVFAKLPRGAWGTAVVATGSLVPLVMNQKQRQALAHCQVPCGIFDDKMRFTGLFEDARTIQKAQAQFQLLSAQKDAMSLHQAVRWLVTKEEHAGKIIENMSEYMLAQRIKPPAESSGPAKHEQYVALLLAVHNVMRMAVLCKQNSDPAHAAKLHSALEECWKLYDAYALH